jgi:hypothetical protein
MEFKTDTPSQVEKVLHTILTKCIIPITSVLFIVHIILIMQIRQELGLADHVWQDKRTLSQRALVKTCSESPTRVLGFLETNHELEEKDIEKYVG